MVARQAELLATSEELSAQLSVKVKMAAQVARAALSVGRGEAGSGGAGCIEGGQPDEVVRGGEVGAADSGVAR